MRTMTLRVQPVSDDVADTAFALLRAVGERLERDGRRQRISRTSRATYDRWQSARANHAVVDGSEIVGIFTLLREPLRDWPDLDIEQVVPFIRALATHPDHRGRGIGALAIRTALTMLEPGEPLYLDCVSDFLPGYYRSLGFETLARQMREYPDDGAFDITLLRHPNGG